jgi:hypothetical protein
MLNVLMQNAGILRVIMKNAVMLSVAGPILNLCVNEALNIF